MESDEKLELAIICIAGIAVAALIIDALNNFLVTTYLINYILESCNV